MIPAHEDTTILAHRFITEHLHVDLVGQDSQEITVVFIDPGVLRLQFGNFAACVEDGSVITSTKGVTNLR